MGTVIAWAGSLAWPVLRWTIPPVSPRLIMAMLAGLLGLAVIGGPALGVWIHMRQEIAAAEARRDAEWKAAFAEAEIQHEQTITQAIIEADNEEARDPTPGAARSPELVRLCNASANCRDRHRVRR